jgi:hypothetical protein
VWGDLCTDRYFVAFRRIIAAAAPNASGALLSALVAIGPNRLRPVESDHRGPD